MAVNMPHFDGADSKKNCPRKQMFSRHIKTSSRLSWSAALAIQIVMPSSRFRISRIMLSAMTRCVRLSRNIFSPFAKATSTTVSTSKARARNSSSLACYKVAAWICGMMAASCSSAFLSAICSISALCSAALPPCPSYVWRV